MDGLFVSPVYRFEAEARIYQEVQIRKIPAVLIGPPAPFCKSFVSVEIDEQAASYTATQHLLKLGHKRIAYFTGSPTAPWAHERFDGYRHALREAGLDVDDKLIFQAGSTIEDGTKAALQMMNESCNATAVQTVNDLVAIGCAEALFYERSADSGGHFARGFRQYHGGGIFSRAADDHPPAQVPARHGRRGSDDEFAERPAR